MRKLKDSRHVVDVFEFTEFPVGFYMPLIRGSDLETRNGANLSPHEQLTLLETIARTLVYAHSHDVIHRDVKPGNVLLDEEHGRVPVLTDFDLAWITGRSTVTSAAFASMKYGPPEQFDDRMAPYRVRRTVDVYSFGALAYFVLTGQEPPPLAAFGEEHWRVLRERLSGKLLATAVDQLVQLLRRCTTSHPESRTKSMRDVAEGIHDIRSLGLDEGTSLSRDIFLRELLEQFGGTRGNGAGEIVSPTGAVTWKIALHSDNKYFGIQATATLLREPRYEGLSHEEFRKAVARRIDTSLRRRGSSISSLASTGAATMTRKHAAIGNAWILEGRVPPTRRGAAELAGIMVTVTGIIE